MLRKGMMLSTINRSQPTPTWTNLLHWYSFDEASGDLLDLYGDDDGTLTGCTQGSTGKINDAYTFNGSTDLITLDTGEVIDWDDFTFAGWCYPTTDEGGIWGGTSGSVAISLYGSYRPRVTIEGGGGSGVAAITMTDSTWNFLTVVRDGDTFRFGINGSYENETFAGEKFTGNFNRIGKTGAYGNWTGMLDEFALFSDVKTDEYLTAIYNSGDGKSYWDGE